MHMEEDTFRVLTRVSFNDIIARQAAYYGMKTKNFYNEFKSRILNGGQPSEDWDEWWPGWTFKEVLNEVVRRKENDIGQED